MKTSFFKTLSFVCIFFIGCNKNEQAFDESNINYKAKLAEIHKVTELKQHNVSLSPELKFTSFKEAYIFFSKNKATEKKSFKQVVPLKANNELGSIKSSSTLRVKKNNYGSENRQYSGTLYGSLFFPTAPITVIVSCAPNIEYAYYDDGRGAFDSKSYYYFQPSTYGINDVAFAGGSIEVTGGSISGGYFTNYITQTYTIEVGGVYYNVQRNVQVQGSISINISLPQYEVPSSISMYLNVSGTVL